MADAPDPSLPAALQLAAQVVRAAPCPLLLAWGPAPLLVANDAYTALAGADPGAPLARARDAFAAAQAGSAAQARAVTLGWAGGAAFDLHFTPLQGAGGLPAGVLCAPQAAAPAAPARAGLRILVVEDNLDSQYLVCEMLRVFGHHADGAASAEAALALLAEGRYTVLLTDVGLPGLSGVELARRAVHAQPALAVIFATGFGESLLRHVEFPYAALQKPYEIEQLQALLDAVDGTPPSV